MPTAKRTHESGLTEEQPSNHLREADQRFVPEVVRKHGVNALTICGWRTHVGSLDAPDVKRLR